MLLQYIESKALSYYEHKDIFYTPNNNLKRINCSIVFYLSLGFL